MSLPTKQNRILPLQCQPNFPGKRTKNMHEKKLWVYPENKIRVFFFTINSVSQARRQKNTCMKKEMMGLPTKQNKSLLLHHPPTFPGKKAKKCA